MVFKNYNILVVAVAALLFLAACTTESGETTNNHDDGIGSGKVDDAINKDDSEMMGDKDDSEMGVKETPEEDEMEKMPAGVPSWFNIELTDVNSGDTFRLNDYKGQTIVLESFAVWCPTCTKQQSIMKEQRSSESGDVVHLSLDLDPNENEAKVKEHATNNGFDWLYSVSPNEMTEGLVAEFGPGIASAPSVPVVIICEDQTFTMMGRGLKTAEELNEEVAKCSA